MKPELLIAHRWAGPFVTPPPGHKWHAEAVFREPEVTRYVTYSTRTLAALRRAVARDGNALGLTNLTPRRSDK